MHSLALGPQHKTNALAHACQLQLHQSFRETQRAKHKCVKRKFTMHREQQHGIIHAPSSCPFDTCMAQDTLCLVTKPAGAICHVCCCSIRTCNAAAGLPLHVQTQRADSFAFFIYGQLTYSCPTTQLDLM